MHLQNEGIFPYYPELQIYFGNLAIHPSLYVSRTPAQQRLSKSFLRPVRPLLQKIAESLLMKSGMILPWEGQRVL